MKIAVEEVEKKNMLVLKFYGLQGDSLTVSIINNNLRSYYEELVRIKNICRSITDLIDSKGIKHEKIKEESQEAGN